MYISDGITIKGRGRGNVERTRRKKGQEEQVKWNWATIINRMAEFELFSIMIVWHCQKVSYTFSFLWCALQSFLSICYHPIIMKSYSLVARKYASTDVSFHSHSISFCPPFWNFNFCSSAFETPAACAHVSHSIKSALNHEKQSNRPFSGPFSNSFL